MVLDYNRDGSPDFLVTQVAAPTVLLENRARDAHWLTVAPEGAGDAGINARIVVTAGGRTQQQIILAGGSYLAGPPREAYFGVGGATVVDRVVVRWADGAVTDVSHVTADHVLRVRHPDPAPPF